MNIFSFIKANTTILDVVGEYVTLKKAGHYYKGSCPLHHEKTGSFTVSPHKDIFYCFGCHAGGDVITFIAAIEHCSPIEAAKLLAERYQIEIPEGISQEFSSQSFDEKKQYFTICQKVAEWCHKNLMKNASARAYLERRNITKESLEHFKIGYFPGGLQNIKTFLATMQKDNILAEDLVHASILTRGKTVYYSSFEERIIFPIKDGVGRFCGFGGRVFKPQDTRAKYYNSRENEHFTKGSLLFGLDLAKKSIADSQAAFLVEGYTDCVAMVQHGYPNTVATLGTACTLEHLKTISRYAQNLYILYDSDKAGTQAVLRLTELCWHVNLELQVIRLPKDHDPASYLDNHKNLKVPIAEAQDIFAFFIATLGKEFAKQPISTKLARTRKIIDIISKISDPLKLDMLTLNAAKALDIPFESLKAELDRKNQSEPPKQKPEAFKKTSSSSINMVPALEKRLFSAIMNNMQLLEGNALYVLSYLKSPLKDILIRLNSALKENPELTFSAFFDMLSSDDQKIVSQLIVEQEQEVQAPEFTHMITSLQRNYWKLIVNDIKLKIDAAKRANNPQAVQTLLEEFMRLKKSLVNKDLV